MAANRWMCTCNKGKNVCISPKHQKLYPTEVNEEEICIYCGFYAYAEPNHELYPLKKIRNGKWNREISRSRSEWYRKFGAGGKAKFKAWEGSNQLISHGFNDQEILPTEEKEHEYTTGYGEFKIKRAGRGVK